MSVALPKEFATLRPLAFLAGTCEVLGSCFLLLSTFMKDRVGGGLGNLGLYLFWASCLISKPMAKFMSSFKDVHGLPDRSVKH